MPSLYAPTGTSSLRIRDCIIVCPSSRRLPNLAGGTRRYSSDLSEQDTDDSPLGSPGENHTHTGEAVLLHT